jgi:hypothetical protein
MVDKFLYRQIRHIISYMLGIASCEAERTKIEVKVKDGVAAWALPWTLSTVALQPIKSG